MRSSRALSGSTIETPGRKTPLQLEVGLVRTRGFRWKVPAALVTSMIPASTVTRRPTLRAMPAHAFPRRLDILDLNLSALTVQMLLDIVARAVAERYRLRVAFCSVDTVVQSRSNYELAGAVNEFELASPDGMPLVWLSRLAGVKEIERVDGPNSMLAICEKGVTLGYRHFFYGSTKEALAALEGRLKALFPGIQIVGSFSPPFRALTEAESDDVAQRINRAQPDLVWVGLGMPKQELWVAQNAWRLEAPVILAVGAAFGFTAGLVRRAPRWMQRSGLEWLFRLSQEPRRLWKRYLLGNPYFIWLAARELLLRRAGRNKKH
jgi:N-acetylglucosaminyldiphosphoundecaprenol N-acetyl-beta-D-mannosaminyltransferase